MVEASIDNKVESFILISTDKAVRPTNVMGCSKRLAEIVVQAFAQQKTLIANWLQLHERGFIYKDPFQYGFKTFSQTNEDGILLYIFTIKFFF